MDALGLSPPTSVSSDGGETAMLVPGWRRSAAGRVAWGAVVYYGPAMRPVAQTLYRPLDDRGRSELHGIDNPRRLPARLVGSI